MMAMRAKSRPSTERSFTKLPATSTHESRNRRCSILGVALQTWGLIEQLRTLEPVSGDTIRPIMDQLDPLKPQILVYEPVGGKLQLVAAEWFVPISPEVKDRPQLFGQPFDGPMEGHHPLQPKGLHHYDLHVWLWKENPSGMFAPTNPKVKCPKGPYTLEEHAPRIVPHK